MYLLIKCKGGFSGVKSFEPVRLAVHYLKPFDDEDYCNDEKRWPVSDRYNQTIALGCGSVERRGPFHNTTKYPTHADNYDMYEYFRDHGQDIVVGKVRQDRAHSHTIHVCMYACTHQPLLFTPLRREKTNGCAPRSP